MATRNLGSVVLKIETDAGQPQIETDLHTLATNLPAQGQALAAASSPVVLPALQETALTPPTAAAIASAIIAAAPVEKVPVFLAAVIVGTPGTPLVLAANNTFFTYAVLQAGTATGANTSLISICGNTAYTSQRAIELAPGDTWELKPPAGTKWDLNDFYIDGVTTTDGVRIMYVAP